MKIRFPLRVLLVGTAIVAVLLYWRTRPAALAEQFVRAVKAKEYEQADKLFSQDDRRFLVDENPNEIANVILQPQSFAEWLRGVCRIDVIMELSAKSGEHYLVVRPVTVTAYGLQ